MRIWTIKPVEGSNHPDPSASLGSFQNWTVTEKPTLVGFLFIAGEIEKNLGVGFCQLCAARTTRRALSKVLIRQLHRLRAMQPLQPPHDEMSARHVLKMVNEQRVDDRAANGSNDGHGLSGGFFGHDN